ncbi:MAG: ABC transporter permease [Planctomycetota bacterium]
MSNWKMHPVVQLFLARYREFIRQPEAVFWSYIFPLVMMIALGMAFRNEPMEKIHVFVEDSEAAATLQKSLEEGGRFIVTRGSSEEARRQLRAGKSELIISAGGTSTSLEWSFSFDPTRPGSVHARDSANDVLQRAAGRADVVITRDQSITEPGSRYIDFLVPGLIGMGLMGGGVWGVGFAIVDMRIRQVLKRFLATPMKRPHFVMAMMASRMVFMIPEIIVVLIVARVFFGVVNHGSYISVALLILLGAFEFAGIGLLIASRAKTLEAVSGLMNLAMVPMWIGSGIFFSAERFPEMVQPLIGLLPLTPLIGGLREVMQEGAGLMLIAPQLSLISAWGAVTFVTALKIFRWE